MDCGTTTIKYLLFFFNFLFFVSGIIILTIGAVVKANEPSYASLTGKDVFGVSILLIVVGVFVVIITFFGCCGAIRESRCMLLTFAGLLSLIFVMEFAAGIAAFVYRDDLVNESEKELRQSMKNYNTTAETTATKEWDSMQKTLKCCGAHNYTDWSTDNIFTNGSVPISCCIEVKSGCGDSKATQPNPEGIYQQGCVDKIVHEISSQALIIGGIGIGIAFIQILGIIFACCLASALKN